MQFSRHLHEAITMGDITTTIRIWKQPRVKAGGRYRLGDGQVVVDRIREIDWDGLTADLAIASGFKGVADLLKTARHGHGTNVYLIDFHYEADNAV